MANNPQAPKREVDFVDLNKNEQEAEKALQILRAAKRERNTMIMSEFRSYEPIFRLDGREELGDERFDVLVQEWMSRVDCFAPVLIVADEDHHSVQITIPPMFRKVRPINLVQGGSDINTALVNAHEMADEFGHKKHMWSHYFEQAMRVANPQEYLDKTQAQVNSQVKELRKDGVIRDPSKQPTPAPPQAPESVISNRRAHSSSNTERINADLGDADVEPL